MKTIGHSLPWCKCWKVPKVVIPDREPSPTAHFWGYWFGFLVCTRRSVILYLVLQRRWAIPMAENCLCIGLARSGFSPVPIRWAAGTGQHPMESSVYHLISNVWLWVGTLLKLSSPGSWSLKLTQPCWSSRGRYVIRYPQKTAIKSSHQISIKCP